MKDELSLPKGWELKTIGDVCVSASSNVSQNKLANDEGDYPIFGASGLIKKVSFYHRDKPYLSIVKDGSGFGRITKMDAYTSVIGTLQYILPKENIDLDYLNYSLMSVDFKKYVAGAAIPHIYFKDYKNEPFLWMPLPEQQRIVTILDECFAAIDKAKANAEQNLKNANELFRSSLQAVFENKGGGWKKILLKDACSVFADGNWIESKDQSQDGIRLVQTGNIGFGVFKDKEDKARFISEETFHRLRCTEILAGDLLVSRLPDPVGKSCIIPEINSKMITGVDCTIIRPKDNLSSKFLCYYQMSNQYLKDVQSLVSGSTRQRISRKNLGIIEIPLPSLDLQKRIVQKLDAFLAEIKKLEAIYQQKINDLEELKKSVLQKAFSGELRTQTAKV
jgi:type I restriction enzyme S subunit